MTNNDRDIFSQVISTGSRDQEIEVSLSSFSSLHHDALEPAVEVKLENAAAFSARQSSVDGRALSSSFESTEEDNGLRGAVIDSNDESSGDLDCILAEAEGELMALLGGSVTKSGDSDDKVANVDDFRIEDSEAVVTPEMYETAELIDLPTPLTHGEREELVALSMIFSEESAAVLIQQSLLNVEASHLGRTELETLDTKEDLDDGIQFDEIQLANHLIEEDSVVAEEVAPIEMNKEQTANGDDCLPSPPTVDGVLCASISMKGDNKMTDDAVLVKDADIESATRIEETSRSDFCELAQVADRAGMPIPQVAERIEVHGPIFELSSGMSLFPQLDEVLETFPGQKSASVVLENNLFHNNDVSFNYEATTKPDHGMQSDIDPAGYDEEKKWDSNSMSYPSVDQSVCDNDEFSSIHSQVQSHPMEGTERGTFDFAGSVEQKTSGDFTANKDILLVDDPSLHIKWQINCNATIEPSSTNCGDTRESLRILNEEFNGDGAATGDTALGSRDAGLGVPEEESTTPDDGKETQRVSNEQMRDDGSATCDTEPSSQEEVLDMPQVEDESPKIIAKETHSTTETLIIGIEESNDVGATTCDAEPRSRKVEPHTSEEESQDFNDDEATLRIGNKESSDDCFAMGDAAPGSQEEILDVLFIDNENPEVIGEAASVSGETLRLVDGESNDDGASKCHTTLGSQKAVRDVPQIETQTPDGGEEMLRIAIEESNDDGAATCQTTLGSQEAVLGVPQIETQTPDYGEETLRIAIEESNDDGAATCDTEPSSQEEVLDMPQRDSETPDDGEETLRRPIRESNDDGAATSNTGPSSREVGPHVAHINSQTFNDDEETLGIGNKESSDDCFATSDAAPGSQAEIVDVRSIANENPEVIGEASTLRLVDDESNDDGASKCHMVPDNCEEESDVMPSIEDESLEVIAEVTSGSEETLRLADGESNDVFAAKRDTEPSRREVELDISQVNCQSPDYGEETLRIAIEELNDDGAATCDTEPSSCEVDLHVSEEESQKFDDGKELRIAHEDSNDDGAATCDTAPISRPTELDVSQVDTQSNVDGEETPRRPYEDSEGDFTSICGAEANSHEAEVDAPQIESQIYNDGEETLRISDKELSTDEVKTLQIVNIEMGNATVSSAEIAFLREDAGYVEYGEDTARATNGDSNVAALANEGLFDRADTMAEFLNEGVTCYPQKTPESSRPPLFPSKRLDLHENPDELLNFLSNKLKLKDLSQGSTGPVPLSRTSEKVFDPDLSVFARMESDVFGTSDISPPGSPTASFFNKGEDESSSDESGSVSSRIPPFALVHPDIAPWDMISSHFLSLPNPSKHPELIVTGDSVDRLEPSLPDLHQGPSCPDVESSVYKESTALVGSAVVSPYERTTLVAATVDELRVSSTAESVCRLNRQPFTSASAWCRGLLRFQKGNKAPILSLCKSAEEPLQKITPEDFSSFDAQRLKDGLRDDSSKHLSTFRRTVSLPNLQSPGKEYWASSDVEDQKKDLLLLSNESLVTAAKEGSRGVQVAQTNNTVSLSPEGMCIEPKRFSSPFLQYDHGEGIGYMASLQWKQLQATWLHNVVALSSFLNQPLERRSTFSNSDEPSYSASIATSHCMTFNSRIRELHLCRIPKCGTIFDSSKLTNDLLRLSAFFACDPMLSRPQLKHNISLDEGNEVELLLSAALSRLDAFSDIVRDIGGHKMLHDASMNCEGDDSGVRYFIDIKKARALQRKATRKYDGDILQVKDVLRGSIVFPNGGALVCGLSRLIQIVSAQNQNTGGRENVGKLCIVRVKNLFQESSPGKGLIRSSLPTSYRHILVNVEMDDEFIAEIQFNLSAFFDVLGNDGPILHQDLNNLHDAVTARGSALASLDIYKFSDYATGSTSQAVREKVEAEVTASVEEVGSEKMSTQLHSSVDSTRMPKNEKIRWTDMKFEGILSDESKDEFLINLRNDTTPLSEEDISLALLECASACASEKPGDPACSFCLCLVILYCAQRNPAERIFRVCDNISKSARPLSLARSCLVKCLSICNQSELDDNSAFTHPIGVASNVLTLLAFTYAEDERWNDAASVLETLILRCEERCTRVSPILITALFDFGSMSRRAGNHSHASHFVARATERVSMLLVETEVSYMEYLRNASKDTTTEAPFFYMDNGRESFENLRQFIIMLQDINEQTCLQRFRDSWIRSIYHRILGDAFAVLANCEQATWIYLPTNSTDQSHNMKTSRVYWGVAFSHFEKAFAGFSAVAGFENRDVSGAVFGMTRCLRELGETDKAVELLSMVVAGLENVAPVVQGLVNSAPKPSPSSYLAHAISTSKQDLNQDQPQVHHHIMRALCLWWMSILSVDKSKDEDGRTRAFRFLHTSSVSLQLALTEMHRSDEKTRKVCVDFLEKIELEAKHISQQR